MSQLNETKDYLKIDELVNGHAYKIYARNAFVGIWLAEELGFIISRYKVGDYPDPFVEYHWDTNDEVNFPYGTAKPLALIEPAPFTIKNAHELSEAEKNKLVDYLNRLERENPIIEGYNTWENRRNAAIRYDRKLAGDFLSDRELFEKVRTQLSGRERTAALSILKRRGYSEQDIDERLLQYKPLHPVLIGDSIFANGHSVEPGQSVVEQLQARLTEPDKVSLLAVDGAKLTDVEEQFAHLPADASHVFISCGGRDVWDFSPRLDKKVANVAEALRLVFERGEAFREQYRTLIQSAKSLHKRVCVCTIYNSIPGDNSIRIHQEGLSVLGIFNEIILQTAVEFHVPVIDLRVICNEPEDYSARSMLDPSEQGGKKITRMIQNIIRLHDFREYSCQIYS